MQTFLPYADFYTSAETLDYRRLGKQRVEAYQIYRTLTGQGKGWDNHPAVKMWRGYEYALSQYIRACIRVWQMQGYKNTMAIPDEATRDVVMPPWMGNPEFHASHRSNLLRKDPVWYGQFGWAEPDNLPYVWPV